MKLITLNTWGGRITKELFDFLDKKKATTDIFCFQEIYHRATHVHVEQGGIDPNLTLFDDIEKILTDYQSYFRPQYLETYGLAAFVKNHIHVIDEGEYYVHHHKGFIPGEIVGNHARNVQSISIQHQGGDLHIFNFHGLWNGVGKADSKPRLEQSRKLIEYIKNFKGTKVLCGDFNLLPDTESLKLVEDIPLRNLVEEYGVTSTRTSTIQRNIVSLITFL